MAGMDHRTVWRFTGVVLGQGLLHARWCAMRRHGPDSAENCLAIPQVQAHHHGHRHPRRGEEAGTRFTSPCF